MILYASYLRSHGIPRHSKMQFVTMNASNNFGRSSLVISIKLSLLVTVILLAEIAICLLHYFISNARTRVLMHKQLNVF